MSISAYVIMGPVNNQSKIVTSRRTTYTGTYPLIPKLHKFQRLLVIIDAILLAALIYVIQSGVVKSIDARILAFALYLSSYLFIVATLASISLRRPAHKILRITVMAISIATTLGFVGALLITWLQSIGTLADESDTWLLIRPDTLFVWTLVILRVIPPLVKRYVSGFRQMRLEIQDSLN